MWGTKGNDSSKWYLRNRRTDASYQQRIGSLLTLERFVRSVKASDLGVIVFNPVLVTWKPLISFKGTVSYMMFKVTFFSEMLIFTIKNGARAISFSVWKLVLKADSFFFFLPQLHCHADILMHLDKHLFSASKRRSGTPLTCQYNPRPGLNWDVSVSSSQIYKSLIEYEKWNVGMSGEGGREINDMDLHVQTKPIPLPSDPHVLCACMRVCTYVWRALQHYWTSEWVMTSSQTGQLPPALIY